MQYKSCILLKKSRQEGLLFYEFSYKIEIFFFFIKGLGQDFLTSVLEVYS
jgi:hypothetical protein